METDEWLERFAVALGQRALSEEDAAAVLDLAGIAAHASQRMAAPLTCWLAASAGMTPTAALALAHSLAAEEST